MQKRKMNQFCRLVTCTSCRDMLLLAHRPLHGRAVPAHFRDLVCDCFLWCSSARVDSASPRVFTNADGASPRVFTNVDGASPRVWSTRVDGASPRVLSAQCGQQ